MALPATASLPQSESIVSRWLLDEASGNRSDSVGSSTLTDNNTVASGTGLDKTNGSDTAADFEAGNTEYLSVADSAGLSPTGDFGFACWLKVESAPGEYTICSKYNGGSARSFLFRYVEDSGKKLNMIISSNGSTDVAKSVTVDLSTATWAHIAFVYDASAGEGDFYVNGSAVGTTQTGYPTSIFDGTQDFRLGAYTTDGSTPTGLYDGLMQDAILWSGVELSASEISDLYNAYLTANFTPKVIVF